jgi:hypothetical protein
MIRFREIDDATWANWHVWDLGRFVEQVRMDGKDPADISILEFNRKTGTWRPKRVVNEWLLREVGEKNYFVDVFPEKLYIFGHINVMAFMLRWG